MGVDVACYECGIDMVDGALGTLDLTLSKRDMIGFASLVFLTEGGGGGEKTRQIGVVAV